MDTQRRLVSIVIVVPVLISISATRFVAARSHPTPSARSEPAACTLLTTADVSKALEASSQPGKELGDSKGCVWSNDPAASDTSRRVTLVTHSLTAFRAAKQPAITTIKIEPVSGLGDEAFYQVYPKGQGAFIWVRAGNIAFDVRVMTRVEPKAPFTLEQEKSKEAVLAKAALAKLAS